MLRLMQKSPIPIESPSWGEHHWQLSTQTIQWCDLEIDRALGSGSFSCVHRVWLKEGIEAFDEGLAIKLPLPPSADNETLAMAKEDMLNEAKILSKLSHPNIIALHFVSDPSDALFFLIMSRLVDTLDNRINGWRKKSRTAWKPLPFATRLEAVRLRLEEVALGIAHGLEYLHSKGVIHRDIKPQNVGFDEFGSVVLFDFGLSREVRKDHDRCQLVSSHQSLDSIDFDIDFEEDENEETKGEADGHNFSDYELTRTSTGVAGTPRYMAPELVREEDYGLACDTYSFSILLWELATLQPAFPNFRGAQELFENVHGVRRLRPSLVRNKCIASMSDFSKLLHNMWQHESTKRPSMERVRVELEKSLKAEGRRQPEKGEGATLRSTNRRRLSYGSSRHRLLLRRQSLGAVNRRASPEAMEHPRKEARRGAQLGRRFSL